jgi:hypothetical protein
MYCTSHSWLSERLCWFTYGFLEPLKSSPSNITKISYSKLMTQNHQRTYEKELTKFYRPSKTSSRDTIPLYKKTIFLKHKPLEIKTLPPIA